MSIEVQPTVSQILATLEPDSLGLNSPGDRLGNAEHEWQAAIATLAELLQQTCSAPAPQTMSGPIYTAAVPGIILTGPAPFLGDTTASLGLQSWVFNVAASGGAHKLQLPPAQGWLGTTSVLPQLLPILPQDPLADEQFCLILTPQFSSVAVLGQTPTGAKFQISFTPIVVRQVWKVLRSRLLLAGSPHLYPLEILFHQLAPRELDYRIPMQFSRLLLKKIATDHSAAQMSPIESSQATVSCHHAPPNTGQSESAFAQSSNQENGHLPDHKSTACQDKEHQTSSASRESGLDVELLAAIAHEVRTPLTTISTLTRLLLKRSDLPAEAVKRLEAIYRECIEQIDRFSLIFRAVELESHQRSPLHLSAVSLAQVFQQNLPRWQKQAARRNLDLEVKLPQNMPAVFTDPTLLDQVLTGLVEHLSHRLPMGSQIQVQVTLAGEQLKLQLRSHSRGLPDCSQDEAQMPLLKSVGRLLMVQQETGNLSLSLPVTKNLFQALGGKLTIRKCPQQGEILTVFLPLGRESNAY